MIDVLDAVSLAGARHKPNEDALGASLQRAWVIDGATGLGDTLMPGNSDAAWIARRANDLFHRFADVADTQTMLADVAAALEQDFLRERGRAPLDRWEIPCAAFMMLTARPGQSIEVAHLGDCRAILCGKDNLTHVIGATPESEKREAQFAAKFAVKGDQPRFRSPKALDALRTGRAQFNTAPQFGGVLAPEAAFLPFVKIETFALRRPAHALLMTDGFAALSLRYGDIGDEAFIASAQVNGLARLAVRLRKIEEDVDPGGAQFPRWKRSDDATAQLLAIS